MTERHGGNLRTLAARAGRPAGEILDFSANINPLGPPEGLRTAISAHLSDLVHYPDPACTALRERIAALAGVGLATMLQGATVMVLAAAGTGAAAGAAGIGCWGAICCCGAMGCCIMASPCRAARRRRLCFCASSSALRIGQFS